MVGTVCLELLRNCVYAHFLDDLLFYRSISTIQGLHLFSNCSFVAYPDPVLNVYLCMRRFVSEMEMKLHLGAEDTSLQLEDLLSSASQRLPLANRELIRLKEDALSVRINVESTLETLKDPDPEAEVLAQIIELDTVKSRMQDACTTLKEAAGLSSLFALVEDMFLAKDYMRIADALSGIRRGLNVVADCVPEFSDGRERLASLEERLAEIVSDNLSDAFQHGKSQEVATLSGIMLDIGKQDKVYNAYKSARLSAFQKSWEGYTAGTPFVAWLATFYDEILQNIASELRWCKTYMIEQYPNLVLDLIQAFFESINKPARARIAGALTGPPGSIYPLESLEQIYLATKDFILGLRNELSDAGAFNSVILDIPDDAKSINPDTNKTIPFSFLALFTSALGPLEGALDQYPDFEFRYLDFEFSKLLQKVKDMFLKDYGNKKQDIGLPLASRSFSTILSDAVDRALVQTNSSLERCSRLSEYTSVSLVTKSCDRALNKFVNGIMSFLIHHPSLSEKTRAELDSKQGIDLSIEDAMCCLISIARLQNGIELLNSIIKENAKSTLNPLLSTVPLEKPGMGSDTGKTGNTVRSLDALGSLPLLRLCFPETPLVEELQKFLLDETEPFANSFATVAELLEGLDKLFESALLRPIENSINGIPSLNEWKSKSSAAAGALPTFNTYPQQYITSIGEHLMMLPQLLGSILASIGKGKKVDIMLISSEGTKSSENSNEQDSAILSNETSVRSPPSLEQRESPTEEDEIVGSWVDRAALSTASQIELKLWEIKILSSNGSNQLGADMEYFSNVLSTLGLPVPDTLIAWQAAASAPDHQALKELLELESADVRFKDIIKKVEILRGFKSEK